MDTIEPKLQIKKVRENSESSTDKCDVSSEDY